MIIHNLLMRRPTIEEGKCLAENLRVTQKSRAGLHVFDHILYLLTEYHLSSKCFQAQANAGVHFKNSVFIFCKVKTKLHQAKRGLLS